MTQQNNSNNEYDRLIQEAREQIQQQQYLAAIDNLNEIIENSERNGYAFYLRGKAYAGLKEYQPAMNNYETALDIFREIEDKKYQIYTLFELTFVYGYNGRVKEGFLAQQQTYKLAKELDISEDDPLYDYVSHVSQMSDEGLDKMESQLRNIDSIPPWDKFGLMGKLMGYGTKGKLQSYLFFFVWLLFAIPAFALAILTSPFWLPMMIYKSWRRRDNDS